MKKMIILFTIVVILLVSSLILFEKYKDEEETEVVYSLNTNYAYLNNDSINIIFKVYSNLEKSLLRYAKEANVMLHDKNKENVVTVVIEDSFISNTAIYDNRELYEYSLKTLIDITDFNIQECYLSLKFTNKEYVFYIGDLDVRKSNCLINKLSIINLYGLSSENDISMSGIVVSLKNNKDKTIEISGVSVGGCYNVCLYEEDIEVKESTKIEYYISENMDVADSIRIYPGQTKTFIISLGKESDCYLYNNYILLNVDGIMCYIENFNYIDSNDLEALRKYVKVGMIYEI